MENRRGFPGKITTALRDYGNLPLKDLILFTIKSLLRAEIFY